MHYIHVNIQAADDCPGERAPTLPARGSAEAPVTSVRCWCRRERHARTHSTPRGRSVLRRSLRLVALVAEDTVEPLRSAKWPPPSWAPAQLAGGRGSHTRSERVARILCTSSKASSVVLEKRFKFD